MGKLVQIRDVPEELHRTLKARAALSGRSLSDLLRGELERFAARPTEEEIRERLASLEPVEEGESGAEAVAALRRDAG